MTQGNQQPINVPMFELFQSQTSTHASAIVDYLEPFDKNLGNSEKIIALVNAAGSIKQSARLVQYQHAIEIAHVLEDYFKSVRDGDTSIGRKQVNILLKATELLLDLARADTADIPAWTEKNAGQSKRLTTKIAGFINDTQDRLEQQDEAVGTLPVPAVPEDTATPATAKTDAKPTRQTEENNDVLADESMLELFRIEAETLSSQLGKALLNLENNPEDKSQLEAMMRAAHSIKGAARMVKITCAVEIAHLMEDCFVAAQQDKIKLHHDYIDVLLNAVDFIEQLSHTTKATFKQWLNKQTPLVEKLVPLLKAVLAGDTINVAEIDLNNSSKHQGVDNFSNLLDYDAPVATENTSEEDRVLRVTAGRINNLMGLSSELLVTSGWIGKYSDSLLSVKRKQAELISAIDRLRGLLEHSHVNEQVTDLLGTAQSKANECRQLLSSRLNELEEYDRRTVNLAGQLNHEVLASRMRPFADGVQGMQRMVRDLARSLHKKIELVIEGTSTQVDRDILERIEAPLNHIIRNAVDHAIESPEQRIAQDKPETGTIKINANHSSGMLSITVSDDGCGIDLNALRERIIRKNLVHEAIAADLSDAELLEFLFLPGFSTRDQVTELSGRGVGLDVAHSVVQEMRGKIRAFTKLGAGSRIHMQLPLTLSVVRCLLVQIAQEPYAFPLARIESVLNVPRSAIQSIEDRQYINYEHNNIGLVDAAQVLDMVGQPDSNDEVLIVVIGDRQNYYGLVVEKSLGEHSLAIQPLESKIGKVRDISAAAVLNDGSPVLIIDVDDMIRSIEHLISGHRLSKVQQAGMQSQAYHGKRILVVDDSLTVREVERKLLESRGYEVDVAVDGMDGWNTVRVSHYDLVITDVDMPRMNGIEFVERIKTHPKLKELPVMIVSYKDRDEDRQRGLDVGADYYLTKGSFHDDSLLDAVVDLIGYASK